MSLFAIKLTGLSNKSHVLCFLVISFTLTFITACGGGSSGSGIVHVDGTMRGAQFKELLGGVQITDLSSGSQTTSAYDGTFSLIIPFQEERAEIQLRVFLANFIDTVATIDLDQRKVPSGASILTTIDANSAANTATTSIDFIFTAEGEEIYSNPNGDAGSASSSSSGSQNGGGGDRDDSSSNSSTSGGPGNQTPPGGGNVDGPGNQTPPGGGNVNGPKNQVPK